MNRVCNTCNIKIDKNTYLKDKTVCKTCYNNNIRKNDNKTTIENEIVTSPQQPKIGNVNKRNTNTIVSTYEKHRQVVIGPSNVGKTYYMLKILEKKCSQRPIHIITRSPNQCPKNKTSIEYEPINKHKGSVIIFDEMLGARNCS